MSYLPNISRRPRLRLPTQLNGNLRGEPVQKILSPHVPKEYQNMRFEDQVCEDSLLKNILFVDTPVCLNDPFSSIDSIKVVPWNPSPPTILSKV